jgi:superfamily II DNA helicase RecQ
MATISTPTPQVTPLPTTQSNDIPSVTSNPKYAAAVLRVNEIVRRYRDTLHLYPASFPNKTQHMALIRMHLGLNVMVYLQTGGGKTFVLVSAPIMMRRRGVFCLVVPLNAIRDQHYRTFLEFKYGKTNVHILTLTNVKETIALIARHNFSKKDGLPLVIIGHPEAFMEGLYAELRYRSYTLRRHIVCLMIDEVQLVLDWGFDFRIWYSQLLKFLRLNSNMLLVTASGSCNPSERDAIRINLEGQADDVLLGPLDRSDHCFDVLESSSMPPRIPPKVDQETATSGDEEEEGEEKKEDGDDEETSQVFGAQLKSIIFKNVKQHPSKGFLVYCETEAQCTKYAADLCAYFTKHKSSCVAYPFSRTAPYRMEAILEAFSDPNNLCQVLCCTVVLAMGVHMPHVHGAFLKRLAFNLSLSKQIIDRSHRIADPSSSYGVVGVCLGIQDFRRHMKRAFELQGSFCTEQQQELGRRLENAAIKQFSLFSNPAQCLQLLINTELAGAGTPKACVGGSNGDCCNCRRRRAMAAAAQAKRTEAIRVMQSSSESVANKKKALTQMKSTYLIQSNKSSHTPNVQGWTQDVNVFPDIEVPASINPVVKNVLVPNTKVTTLMQRLVKKALKNARYGIPFADLIKEVEMGTGRRGLSNAQTRWCVTQFMYNGLIEEEEDASPEPEGYERKTKRKVHTKLSTKGREPAAWPLLYIHERIGNFL